MSRQLQRPLCCCLQRHGMMQTAVAGICTTTNACSPHRFRKIRQAVRLNQRTLRFDVFEFGNIPRSEHDQLKIKSMKQKTSSNRNHVASDVCTCNFKNGHSWHEHRGWPASMLDNKNTLMLSKVGICAFLQFTELTGKTINYTEDGDSPAERAATRAQAWPGACRRAWGKRGKEVNRSVTWKRKCRPPGSVRDIVIRVATLRATLFAAQDVHTRMHD